MLLSTRRNRRRQGIVLLIVMAMLALFAGVALSFAFFADGEATLARISRDSERHTAPDAEPEMLLSYFLSQLIYDADDTNGIYSALRGHSLARNLFGYNSTGSNTTPHNGSGRLSYQVALGGLGKQDNRVLINYQYHPNDTFLRDPERLNTRANPTAAMNQFLGEANPAYTYPDLNNVYLGAVNAKGEVLRQSFYRPETGGSLTGNNDVDRYKVLRPHPKYHTQFPPPEDGGGDVKNLDWALGVPNGATYFMNDSYWIDAGFPVLTAPDGRKYKPLFAPFVMDLDNRLNLMVAGNYNTAASKSLSNQGIGRFEQNLAPLDGTGKSRIVAAADMAGIFRGASKSRFGSDSLPDAAAAVTATAAPYYSMYDFDFDTSASGTPSNWQLPTAGSFSMFPTYPATWLSGVGETTNHPAGYSYWFPTGANNDLRPIAAQNMEALLRFGGKNSPALTSDLWAMLPNTLTPSQPNYNPKARNLLTTLSMSFDRPHMGPYVSYDPANSPVPYAIDTTDLNPFKYPKGQIINTPDPAATPAQANSEFASGATVDYRSKFAAIFSRLDLNRSLTEYPPLDMNGTLDPASAAYANAIKDREKFAKDIFDRLVAATGARTSLPPSNSTDGDYKASRFLAQVAVNIVDYIDQDDVMTVFDWRGDKEDMLFGTEMTNLVINEAFVFYDNPPSEGNFKNKGKGAGMGRESNEYRMSVWVELLNPARDTSALGTAYPRNKGIANLANGLDQPIYRLHVCKQAPEIKSQDNPTGTPNAGNILEQDKATKKPMTVEVWGNAPKERSVLPVIDGATGKGAHSGMQASNEGFFVVGPKLDAAEGYYVDPSLSVTYESPALKGVFDQPGNPADPLNLVAPTLVLQRLANPYLSPQNNPALPNYNPFITVDFIENVKANNAVFIRGAIEGKEPAVTQFESVGRRQPLRATNLEIQAPQPAPGNQPKHTFYRQNSTENMPPVSTTTLDDPWEWVVHLDRPLINPLELVHVSCYRPTDLTQLVQPNNQAHCNPWFDSNSLLYRFLELTTTKDRMVGNQVDGRVPGKININTVWDDEIFQALTDPQSWSSFQWSPQGKKAFDDLKTARDGSLTAISNPQPIKSLGVGLNATTPLNFAGNGAPATSPLLLTTNSMSQPLTHRYQQLELLRKIHNNVTTTSNCFAVWVTVGFFEVTDDSVKPAKLGEEIGRRENRHIRHRFFAIVDRSEINLFQNAPLTVVSGTAPGVCEVSLGAGQHLVSQKTINIGTDVVLQPGMSLEVGTGSNLEVVRILQVTGANKFTANFSAPPAGKTVTLRGNPGPQTRYDVRRDSQVVPHYTVID